ncbi:MAG: DUF177 domain-containing protein [Nitrospirae bacterium]|nr:DUF177 domain-containing protein [Nitrospirota bacterium]
MRIALSDIPREGLDLEYDMDPAALDLTSAGAEFLSPIHVRLRLVAMDRAVYLSGEAAAERRLQCVRCLTAISESMRLSFEMNVEPQESETEPTPGEWHELHREELDAHYYSGHTIDLTELVREQILLALPAYPLCRSDCRGICPRCGLDRNRTACRCAADEADRPMTPLQASLKKIIKK